jgi:multiple sugar transport system permease protein
MSARSVRRIPVWTVLKWALALIVAAIALFPIWWMINVVFALPGEPVSINPRLWPTSVPAGIDKIHLIFTETDYLHAYSVSLTYAVLTIAGVLLIGSLAAFEFALFAFPGRGLLFGIVMLSLMVPTAVTIIPTYLLTSQLGWLNTMRGLVIPGLASAFG